MAREIHFRVTSLRMLLSLSPLFFSFADLSTDIYSINYNLSNDEEFLGNLMIGLVVSNLAVQSLGTLLVNSRVGMKWMLREFVFTLLMIKPAIAKFAVLTGEGHKRKRKEVSRVSLEYNHPIQNYKTNPIGLLIMRSKCWNR
jgi:hypothetical protein